MQKLEKSDHHRFRLCGLDGGAVHGARADLKPLVLTGKQPGGLLTTTSIVENFPGFPEGVDGYELMTRMQKTGRTLWGQSAIRAGLKTVDFSRKPFALTVDGEMVGAENRYYRDWGEPQAPRRSGRGVAGDQGRDILRDVRWRAAGVPQPAARRRWAGEIPRCEEALYLTRFGSVVHLVHRRDSLRASKIMQERVHTHTKIQADLGFGRDGKSSTCSRTR